MTAAAGQQGHPVGPAAWGDSQCQSQLGVTGVTVGIGPVPVAPVTPVAPSAESPRAREARLAPYAAQLVAARAHLDHARRELLAARIYLAASAVGVHTDARGGLS